MNDFKIFVPLLKASQGSDGRRRLHGIASSTVKDRHGDMITLSALSEMERSANNNLTIFLNHEYKVPEDVAGSVERAVIQKTGDPDVHDLVFDIVVNESNPRAVAAWDAIEGGTQLGLSIGARIPDGGAIRSKDSGRYTIDHIDLLETSLVGVPANPRSWIDYAVKSLNATNMLTASADEPLIEEAAEEAVAEEEQTEEAAVEETEAIEDVSEKSADDELTETTEEPVSDVEEEPASQEAVDGDPENEEVSVEEEQEALASLEPTLVSSLKVSGDLLGSITRELIKTKELLSAAEQERDKAVQTATQVLAETASLMERLASTPIGRKTAVVDVVNRFDGLTSVYGEEFMKMLKKD